MQENVLKNDVIKHILADSMSYMSDMGNKKLPSRQVGDGSRLNGMSCSSFTSHDGIIVMGSVYVFFYLFNSICC